MVSRGGQRTGVAHLPLHYGKAPPWLFQRMVKLSRGIVIAVVEDHGPGVVLQRLSDPYWFQALGCLLGFDWHSSGVTTTVCGALKEGVKGLERDLGLYIAGGKGGTSRKTPSEIQAVGESLGADLSPLVYASRMSAKVDSAALQDGYQLYHHSFFFTASGQWAVVQQGMNEQTRYARRYHWLGERVADFVCEPEAAICAQATGPVLNLVASESDAARKAIAWAATQEQPQKLVGDLERIASPRLGPGASLKLPARHHILSADLHPQRLEKILLSTYERQPKDFEALLALEGVGPATMRALSLLSELVYGAPASARDPARYSFAHGGKDGHPFPVDRRTYDETIAFLEGALRRARLGDAERLDALRRLHRMWAAVGDTKS
ncbi:MAG: DUF763 domain-containing protein [Chloroflexota bacterium]|nr:DUF763 domain-containing protein [Chloroflexota bacterium]